MRLSELATVSNFERLKPPCVGVTPNSAIRLFFCFFGVYGIFGGLGGCGGLFLVEDFRPCGKLQEFCLRINLSGFSQDDFEEFV